MVDEDGMGSVQILSAVGNGVFFVVMLAVSLRLLLLWWRTRQLPELGIGAGFALVAAVGFPLTALGGIGSPSKAGLAIGPAAAGLAAIGAGVVVLQTFTWRVFRPGSRWAAALVVASAAAAVAICIGTTRTLAQAPPDLPPVVSGRQGWLALRLLFESWFLWTGSESLIAFAKARRRLALGLADPVAVNRLLLWGAMGAFLAIVGVLSMVLEWRGLSPLSDPLAASLLAANGLGAGVLMALTFMPPRWYVDLVRRRSGVQSVKG